MEAYAQAARVCQCTGLYHGIVEELFKVGFCLTYHWGQAPMIGPANRLGSYSTGQLRSAL